MTIATLVQAKKLQETINYCDTIIDKMREFIPEYAQYLVFTNDHPRIQIPIEHRTFIYNSVLECYKSIREKALKELEEL